MAEEQDAITVWLGRLAKGDSYAAEVVWQNYFEKLVFYARRKLQSMPLRTFDEEDVALSAMQSFFHGMQGGKFDSLGNREELWRLLLTITARKASAQRRRSLRTKRGSGQVRGESIFGQADPDQDRAFGIAEVLGDEPTPELAAMVVENTKMLLDLLDDDVTRQIALMRLEGHTNEEIAQKLGCARRTVERKLERIRARWGEHEGVPGP